MFFDLVKNALLNDDPDDKITQVQSLQVNFEEHATEFSSSGPVEEIIIPGRPPKPDLVHPSQVARRKLSSKQGRIALIHAICHIEFNAINLALDAVYRFRDMPDTYYKDWLRVATEEAKHFLLLRERLRKLDSDYGELPAHNGLWEMAVKTQHSLVERMALVPRVLEARGLDVTPGMISRLDSVNDIETVDILNIILKEEVGHVEIGSNWFRYACEKENLDPEQTFILLLSKYNVSIGRGPLHIKAREKAGFSSIELEALSK